MILKRGVSIKGTNASGPILLSSDNKNNLVSIPGKGSGWSGISLHTTDKANDVSIYDPPGKQSFKFNAYVDRNELIVRDKSSGTRTWGFYADSNEAVLGQERATLFA